MADLEYDTEKLRKAANDYRDIADSLNQIRKELSVQISDLNKTYWRSQAGYAFEEMYSESWERNIEKYVLVLKELAKMLDEAAANYDNVSILADQLSQFSISE